MIVCVCNRLNETRIRTAIDGGAGLTPMMSIRVAA